MAAYRTTKLAFLSLCLGAGWLAPGFIGSGVWRRGERRLRVAAAAAPPGQPMLEGCVALVTGASRGIGKGCALALAKAGCTVYITGRPKASSEMAEASTATGIVEQKVAVAAAAFGTLEQTAAEIAEAAAAAGNGGVCHHIFCDHTSDASTTAVFKRIDENHAGRLDVLVNNAYDVSNFPKEGAYWWEREHMAHWDTATGAGLRGHYMCSLLAARRMSKRKRGLIVSISGPGGVHPEAKNLEGVDYRPGHRSIPYVLAKSGTDRMMADMAADLKSVGVTAVSLWPGGTLTETICAFMDAEAMRKTGRFESPEFIGRGVAALAGDRDALNKAGKIVMAHELALEYGFTDVDGNIPSDALNMLPLRGEMARPPPYWMPDWEGYRKP